MAEACASCGQSIESDWKACPSCGKSIDRPMASGFTPFTPTFESHNAFEMQPIEQPETPSNQTSAPWDIAASSSESIPSSTPSQKPVEQTFAPTGHVASQQPAPSSIDIDMQPQPVMQPMQSVAGIPAQTQMGIPQMYDGSVQQTQFMGIPQAIPGQEMAHPYGQFGGYMPYTQRQMLSFSEAIKSCFNKFASVDGRAQRSEYWWWILFVGMSMIGTFVTAGILDEVLMGEGMIFITGVCLFYLVIFIPHLSVLGRRFHDIGWSSWALLFIFVPYIGGLIIFVATLIPSQQYPNKYGP